MASEPDSLLEAQRRRPDYAAVEGGHSIAMDRVGAVHAQLANCVEVGLDDVDSMPDSWSMRAAVRPVGR